MEIPSALLEVDKPILLLFAFITVVFAYTLFTLLGFGSALLASAPLANVMPVASVIPLLTLLDCSGSVIRGWRNSQQVDIPALRHLMPSMILGQLAGVLLLSLMSVQAMALLLGIFVSTYGVLGLLPLKDGRFMAKLGDSGVLHGLFGGVLGGAFGSGGFVYASYLERKLESRVAFRATQAVLIALSTSWRLILCIMAGLVSSKLLLTAILVTPAAYVGVLLGSRVDLHLSRSRLLLLLNLLLVGSGVGLIIRYAG
jgi:uncharacterized membrane protein YfcA